MKAIIALGLATSTFVSFRAFAQTQGLEADSFTQVGTRVVIERPYVQLGIGKILISTEEVSGLCKAYDLGKTYSVASVKLAGVDLAKFDANGMIESINFYKEQSAVKALICEAK